MAFCTKCGEKVEDGIKSCPSCGAVIIENGESAQSEGSSEKSAEKGDFTARIRELNNTEDTTASFSDKDIQDNKVMAVLAYIGFLTLIPWFAAPNSKFARYHAKQGMNLFILDIIFIILDILLSLIKVPTTKVVWGIEVEIVSTPWFITLILSLIGIALCILSILGIVNAVKGRAKELPFVGKLFIK